MGGQEPFEFTNLVSELAPPGVLKDSEVRTQACAVSFSRNSVLLRNVADILCSVDVSLQFLERRKGPRVVQWHQRAVALFHQIRDRASILIQCWYVVKVAVSGCL